MRRTTLPPLALLLGACHVGFGNGITIDGIRLQAHHEEVLQVDEWSSAGLRIESALGDVRAEPADGPSTITVVIHEPGLGQAHAVYEEGRVVARAENGAPCAIGAVTVRARGPIPGLYLSTKCGDIEVHDVAVTGPLVLATGLGDIEARGLGEPERIELDTGKGDVSLAAARCSTLSARSGMGDIRVEELGARAAKLASGFGDVEIRRSQFERVEADTGLGDIDCLESSYRTSDFDTGLGSVRTK